MSKYEAREVKIVEISECSAIKSNWSRGWTVFDIDVPHFNQSGAELSRSHLGTLHLRKQDKDLYKDKGRRLSFINGQKSCESPIYIEVPSFKSLKLGSLTWSNYRWSSGRTGGRRQYQMSTFTIDYSFATAAGNKCTCLGSPCSVELSCRTWSPRWRGAQRWGP